MLLPIRTIAVGTAVLFFFAIGIIGSVGGLSPFTCCKRAMLGAAVAYLTAGTAGKAVNAILMQAMIAGQVNQTKKREQPGDSKN
ncbi:MAG TPA: hypothetical protein VLI39_13855 [Sedimentisphaerales bacterium]|nr:hypothetical protein [Sedimentisphaerales bacterium]